MNNDLMISADGIVDALMSLPKALLLSDQEIAKASQELTERQESLEMAKVNASLNANLDGKNAEARALQLKAALAADSEVKIAQTAVAATEASIAQMQAQSKMLSRQFAGMCHVAELRAAQMNLMSKGQSQ